LYQSTDKDLFLNNQPDTRIVQIYSFTKTLRVWGIFSAHHQEFSTVLSAQDRINLDN